MKKRNGILLIIVLVFITVFGAGELMKNDSYNYRNIDEIIAQKYSRYDTKYIESNNYYFILGHTKKGVVEVIEIVHEDQSGDFEFFSTGLMPKMGKFKYVEKETTGMSHFTKIYKDDSYYLIEIIGFWIEDEVLVTDNSVELESIKVTDSSGDDIQFWFKALPSISDNYVIYIEINGNKELLIKGSDIKELLD